MENNEQYIIMSKKVTFLEGLLITAGLIGGAWMTANLIKNAKKKIMYKCPVCESHIEYNVERCPYCDSKLKWK